MTACSPKNSLKVLIPARRYQHHQLWMTKGRMSTPDQFEKTNTIAINRKHQTLHEVMLRSTTFYSVNKNVNAWWASFRMELVVASIQSIITIE